MADINNYYEFGNTQNPSQIIFLLHGVGSNGQDLIQLAPYMAAKLPDALFISPDAPFACDMAPVGFQWFSLQDRSPAMLQAGIETTMPILQKFIQQQCARFDLPLTKAALVGFSQGTMMSLYTAPRLPETLAAVLGFSGALFGEQDIIAKPDAYKKPPIYLAHGQADDVVPVAAYDHAYAALKQAGFTVDGHTTPQLPHSIDEEGIEKGSAFLQKALAE